jgi:hypothetical protein
MWQFCKITFSLVLLLGIIVAAQIVTLENQETFEKNKIENYIDSQIVKTHITTSVCYEFIHKGEEYFLFLFLENLPGNILRSGESASIFKKNGTFVEYVFDIGDSPDFYERWNDFDGKTMIPIEKIKEIHKCSTKESKKKPFEMALPEEET